MEILKGSTHIWIKIGILIIGIITVFVLGQLLNDEDPKRNEKEIAPQPTEVVSHKNNAAK